MEWFFFHGFMAQERSALAINQWKKNKDHLIYSTDWKKQGEQNVYYMTSCLGEGKQVQDNRFDRQASKKESFNWLTETIAHHKGFSLKGKSNCQSACWKSLNGQN